MAFSSSIDSALAEYVRDMVAGALVQGDNITITPNDEGNTITIAATTGGSGYTDEQVRDVLGSTLQRGTNVTVTVDDTGDTVTVAVPAAIVVVEAGSNLSTVRPAGALAVYWQFDAGVDVGAGGVNVVNRQSGDLVYVADA